MWKIGNVFVLMLMIFGMSNVAMAGTMVTVDLDKMTPDQVKQVMEAKKQVTDTVAGIPYVVDKVGNVIESIDGVKIDAWAKAIANGIKTVCTSLSLEANEFIKTPVGVGVAGLLAWKIAGDEISSFIIWVKDLVMITIVYMFVIFVVGWNYKRKRGFIKTVNKETGDVTLTPKYVWDKEETISSHDEITVETFSTAIHSIVFGFCTIIYLIYI